MKSGIATTFDSRSPMPQFPTPDDIRARPHRLVYVFDQQMDAAAYWHSVPAGVDGTGRPGNVFAHVLLDRDAAVPEPPLRPVDLWRSPDWLVPFGPGEVTAAVLAERPYPRPGPIGRDDVLSFLLDPSQWRQGMLSVLLDAVYAAMAGGSQVVLGCESPDWGAMWIACVSHFMSPGTSRRMSFSTLERSASKVSGGRRVDLVVVDRADLAALAGQQGLVLIDDAVDPSLGDLDGTPHLTSRGSAVTVTQWSVIARVAMIDRQTLSGALANIDEIALAVGDVGLDARWPLALAVTRMEARLGDAVPEAVSVISAASPPSLRSSPEDFRRASLFVQRQLSDDTSVLWSQLPSDSAAAESVMTSLKLHAYLVHAVADAKWQSQSGGVPIPDWMFTAGLGEPDHEVRQRAFERAEKLFALVAPHRPGPVALELPVPSFSVDPRSVFDLAAQVIGFVDLCGVLGLLPQSAASRSGLDVDRVAVMLQNAVLPLLVGTAERPPTLADELLGRLRTMRTGWVKDIVRSEIRASDRLRQGPPGTRLTAPVLRFALPTPPQIPDLSVLRRPNIGLDPIVAEYAAALTGRSLDSRDAPPDWVPVAIWAHLSAERGRLPIPPNPAVLDKLWRWVTDLLVNHDGATRERVLSSVTAIIRMFPARLDPEMVSFLLRALPWSVNFKTFCDAVEALVRAGILAPGQPHELVSRTGLLFQDLVAIRKECSPGGPLRNPLHERRPSSRRMTVWKHANEFPMRLLLSKLAEAAASADLLGVNVEVAEVTIASWFVLTLEDRSTSLPLAVLRLFRSWSRRVDGTQVVELIRRNIDSGMATMESLVRLSIGFEPAFRNVVDDEGYSPDEDDIVDFTVGKDDVSLLTNVIGVMTARWSRDDLRVIVESLSEDRRLELEHDPAVSPKQLKAKIDELERTGRDWLKAHAPSSSFLSRGFGLFGSRGTETGDQ